MLVGTSRSGGRFFYLPVDELGRCVGHAFLDFEEPRYLLEFWRYLHDFPEGLGGTKNGRSNAFFLRGEMALGGIPINKGEPENPQKRPRPSWIPEIF